MKYDSLNVLDGQILMILANIHSTCMHNSIHLHALHGRFRGFTPSAIEQIVNRAQKLGLVDVTDDDYERSIRQADGTWIRERIPSKLIRLSKDVIETIKLLHLIHTNDSQADDLLELSAEEAADELRRFDEIAATKTMVRANQRIH